MPLFLRSRFLQSWPLLLALGACASGPGLSSDACAPAAALLGRQMAASGVALPGEAPRRAEMMAALRLANLHLQISQDAASRLFECRAAEAGAVREDEAAGRIWRVTAELRIARIRQALRQEIEAALAVSERIGAADAALVAAASTPVVSPGAATELRQEAELRRLVAANIARRESFGAMVLLAGQITDIEMDRDRASR
jgi:hypothetical protein